MNIYSRINFRELFFIIFHNAFAVLLKLLFLIQKIWKVIHAVFINKQ